MSAGADAEDMPSGEPGNPDGPPLPNRPPAGLPPPGFAMKGNAPPMPLGSLDREHAATFGASFVAPSSTPPEHDDPSPPAAPSSPRAAFCVSFASPAFPAFPAVFVVVVVVFFFFFFF